MGDGDDDDEDCQDQKVSMCVVGVWVTCNCHLVACGGMWVGSWVACGWHVAGGQGERCVGVGWFTLGSECEMIYLICPPLCFPSWQLTASHTYQGSYHIKNS